MNTDNLLPVYMGRVKPEWIDYNGHMNIAYYTMAFDIAMDKFMADQFGMDESYILENLTGPFALQSTYTYMAEMQKEEGFEVFGRLIDYDEKRIHFFLAMFRQRDGALSATCESLSMNVHHESRKASAYSSSMLERIAETCRKTESFPLPEQVGQTIGIRRK